MTALDVRWLSQTVEPRRVGITHGLNQDSPGGEENGKPNLSAELLAFKKAQEGWETTHPPTPSPPVPNIADLSLQEGGDSENAYDDGPISDGDQTSDGGQLSDGGQPSSNGGKAALDLGDDQSEVTEPVATRDSLTGPDIPGLVINEYIEIRRSKLEKKRKKTNQKQKNRNPILLESPILRSTFLDLARDFEGLDEKRKQVYFNFHSYYPDTDASDIEKIWNANA